MNLYDAVKLLGSLPRLVDEDGKIIHRANRDLLGMIADDAARNDVRWHVLEPGMILVGQETLNVGVRAQLLYDAMANRGLTVSEAADRADCSESTARRVLEQLVGRGVAVKRKCRGYGYRWVQYERLLP